MKKIFLLLMLTSSAYAHHIPGHTFRPSADIAKTEGQFFSIRAVRGEGLRFFVIGREEAKLDLSNLKLTVRRLDPYPGEILQLDLENNYFTLKQAVNPAEDAYLELTATSPQRTEVLQLKLKGKAP